MWDLIVSVPDHCLSFYFDVQHVHRIHEEDPFVENRVQNSNSFKSYGNLFMIGTFSYGSNLP